MKFFCNVIFLFWSLELFSYNIVFVHLGDKVPPCLFTAMKQARFLNEEADIYLLSDRSFDEKFFSEERISLVDTHLIPSSQEHLEYLKISKQKEVYTSQRFFVLYDFMKEHRLEKVFHLENDSMLYLDLQELSDKWESLSMAVPFISKVAAVPCFVYFKDPRVLSEMLCHMLLEIAQRKASDMQSIASFYEKSSLVVLPTLMQEYDRRPRKSSIYADNLTSLSFLSQNAHFFPSYIFDAATLGVFFEGNDASVFPLRGPGTIHYRSLFDPRLFFFFWGEDFKGRAVPYLSFKGKEYRIVNLHFHSKRPDSYTSFLKDRKKI